MEDFSETETRALCALTYFTLPAKVEHITEFAECHEADVDRALRSLVNRSLVVPSEELKTFTLVPLVADFLRKKKPEVVAETGDQLDKRTFGLAVENGYDKHDRFPVLDAAWPIVAAALRQFLVGPNDRLQKVSDALHDFLNFTGRWDERLALARDAEGRAVAVEDFSNAARRACQAGWVHYQRGESAEVLACADRAEAYWRRAEASFHEAAFAIRLRGIGHELAENYADAIIAYREALKLWRTFGPESPWIAVGLNDLGEVERLSGDLDSAERDYRESLRIARVIDSREGIAVCTGNLAELALDRQDWPGAYALAREALSLSENIGRLELIASHCWYLAMALMRQDRKAEAVSFAQRAVDIFSQLGSRKLVNARKTLAECET